MNQIWWYAARSSGVVAWVLLTASVVWGLGLSTRVRAPGRTPAWVLDLHRFLGGLATLFVGVHLGALLADSYIDFDVVDLVVPGASPWQPGAVAWGVVGLWLVAAVEVTSLAKRHLPIRWWQRVHILSLPLFVVATLHFAQAGTDAGNTAAVVAMIAASAAVAALVVRRTARQLSKSAGAAPTRPGRLAPTPAGARERTSTSGAGMPVAGPPVVVAGRPH